VATVAGDAANTTLGDILQRDAVMCQSRHISTSMEATGNLIGTASTSPAPLLRLQQHVV
jgi:hypothetical protein